MIYYLVMLVTAKRRKFLLFLETTILLAIGSLLLSLSTGWLFSALCAHILTIIGILIQQQLLQDASPVSQKQMKYAILFAAIFVLGMFAVALTGRSVQNKMQPLCQEALDALTQRDAERWQSCLHPTQADVELQDMAACLAELRAAGIPPQADWQLERMTGYEAEIIDKRHYTTADFRASANGCAYLITITHLRDYDGSGITELIICAD